MMPLMAKKKPQTDEADSTPASNRRGVALHVWLDPELIAALEEYVAGIAPRTTKTAVVEGAIQQMLKDKGFWPRKRQGAS
jgi:hypothetical protein